MRFLLETNTKETILCFYSKWENMYQFVFLS